MSITQVAKMAGVSLATVSRVINSRPSVAPKKVLAVRQAMERLNYRPSATRPGRVPRRESANRTGNIGVYVVGQELRKSWLYESNYSSLNMQLLDGINSATRAAGLNMLVDTVNSLDQLPAAVLDKQLDGSLVYPARVPDAELDELVAAIGQAGPVVLVTDREIGQCVNDQIESDNFFIGESAAKYLVQAGCKTLAFMNHNPNHPSLRRRQCGFAAGLFMEGRQAQWFVSQTNDPDNLHMHGEREKRDYSQLLDQMLASDTRPDGLFIPADRSTACVYGLLAERGIRPGRDIKIISVDNFAPYLDGLDPRPPSFDLNMREIGRVAASRLLWRRDNPCEPPAHIMTLPRLVETQAI
jgi:LacI family transcriptional regulator